MIKTIDECFFQIQNGANIKQGDETIIHGMNLLRLKARHDVINPAYARYCFYGRPFRSQVRNITKKSVKNQKLS